MAVVIATHSGPFHADDVMACALIRQFFDPQARVIRTRDQERIDGADIVVDVGGAYEPGRRRFDHHQSSYDGPLSSAGMVLKWLEHSEAISRPLAAHLRTTLVDYLDDVDNGRVAPKGDVPCFPRIVEALNQPARNQGQFDFAFAGAVDLARRYLTGLVAQHERFEEATEVVVAAMADAQAAGRAVLFFDEYISWKVPYFANGGETHPTDFALFPGTDGSWRIVAIPPRLGDFGQKRSLPEAWAGLLDDDLARVVGVPGAVFCHKNRFIAVFKTREGALEALEKHGLMAARA